MLRQLPVFVIVIVGISMILMNFQPMRQIAAGLLASAGPFYGYRCFATQKSLSAIVAALQVRDHAADSN